MTNNSEIGSEWKKWDLHVHTPKTFLNNQFNTVEVDGFIKKILESNLSVIGLTNYFRFEGAELTEIKPALENKGIVVFPNVEFRIKPENKENEDMHIHLIFSNEIKDMENTIKNFLARVKTFDDKYCSELTPEHIKKQVCHLIPYITL
ncbi:MAG: hypothetical protein LBT18_04825 [Endomicrobium sp.]|jgi:predicted metal-dependent phosphoesterase TrpH|nr:hypothetical protein [Endomicrobium sp.]